MSGVEAYSYRSALVALGGAQKHAARGAPAYSRFVNRRLGRYLAAAAATTRLTPNGVTGISALFTMSGIGVLALAAPSLRTGVVVALLLVIGYALDSADGQLARLRRSSSPAGEWLDHVVDAVKVTALPLGLLVGLARSGEVATAWLAVPLVSAVVSSVLFFTMILTEQLRRATGTVPLAAPGGGPRAWLRSVLAIPTDYGLLCLSFLLLGALPVFLVVYAGIVAATAGFLVLACVKWYREIAATPRPTPAPQASRP